MNQAQSTAPQASFKLSAICEQAGVGPEAFALIEGDVAPRRYLELLIGHNLRVDAIKFLAAALPKRAAVWWACLCLERLSDYKPTDSETHALTSARTWVADADSSDQLRRDALPAAEAAGFGTPAGCTALAAYMSGGSLAPSHLQSVPPASHLTAKLVANALILAGVTQDPAQAPARYDLFLKTGMAVAGGEHPWPQPASSESRGTR